MKTAKKDTKKKTAAKKTTKTPKKKMFSVELRHVKLSKESKKALRKIKEPLWGNVANAIECGDWSIPSDTHEFIDLKESFEDGMYEFFDIPKDVLVEIDCFETGILSFEKGVYPKYH